MQNLRIGSIVSYEYSSEHASVGLWKVTDKMETFGCGNTNYKEYRYEIVNKASGVVVSWVRRKDITKSQGVSS